jgi:DNA replicative helicase MCM subunit Mcm2 (Cdc46/Mcm family)
VKAKYYCKECLHEMVVLKKYANGVPMFARCARCDKVYDKDSILLQNHWTRYMERLEEVRQDG